MTHPCLKSCLKIHTSHNSLVNYASCVYSVFFVDLITVLAIAKPLSPTLHHLPTTLRVSKNGTRPIFPIYRSEERYCRNKYVSPPFSSVANKTPHCQHDRPEQSHRAAVTAAALPPPPPLRCCLRRRAKAKLRPPPRCLPRCPQGCRRRRRAAAATTAAAALPPPPPLR